MLNAISDMLMSDEEVDDIVILEEVVVAVDMSIVKETNQVRFLLEDQPG